jgi:hypothetical protein
MDGNAAQPETENSTEEAGASAPAPAGETQASRGGFSYSRWDNLEVSDEDEDNTAASTQSLAAGCASILPGARVRIQHLRSNVTYNGLIGTVEEDLGAGLFCVRLDKSARRLKVRAMNIAPLDSSDPHARMSSPAATNDSSPGEQRNNTAAQATAQPSRAAGAQPTVSRGFLQGNNIHVELQGPLLNDVHVEVQQQAGPSVQHPDAPHQTHGPHAAHHASFDTVSQAMILAFNRQDLCDKYGRFFKRGCTWLIYDALKRRGHSLCGDPAHMRDALLRLSLQLEAEIVAAREVTEHQAFIEFAVRSAGPAGGQGEAGPSVSGVEVLERLDQLTRDQRMTLWAVDAVKYGRPLETALRHMHLSASR